MTFIHRRLCSIKDNDLPFGGLNIILIGDFFQLRPVRGKYLFKIELLWPLFKTFILQQNMRQALNCSYAHMLNRIRTGAVSDHDVFALKSRLVPLY